MASPSNISKIPSNLNLNQAKATESNPIDKDRKENPHEQPEEQKEETEWFRVSAWNKLAETCNQYVVKGMKVYVEGRVSSSAWTDQEGQARSSLEINCTEVQFLTRVNTEQNDNENFQSSNPDSQNIDNPEDLPW